MRKLIFIAFLMVCALANGQGIKISALPNAGTLTGNEYVPVVQSSVTKKTTTQAIADLVGDSFNGDSVSNYAWSLTGNSGTDPATNFIGTTDGADLLIGSNPYATGMTSKLLFESDRSSATLFVFDSIGNQKQVIGIGGGSIDIQTSNFTTDTSMALRVSSDSIYFECATLSTMPFVVLPNSIKIQDGTQGAGKVLTSDANGLASWSNQILTDTAILDFGNILANGHEVLTITVSGASLGDVVSLGIPNASMSNHASFVAWVSASDTVSVKCFNFDGTGFDPASGVYKVKVFK